MSKVSSHPIVIDGRNLQIKLNEESSKELPLDPHTPVVFGDEDQTPAIEISKNRFRELFCRCWDFLRKLHGKENQVGEEDEVSETSARSEVERPPFWHFLPQMTMNRLHASSRREQTSSSSEDAAARWK